MENENKLQEWIEKSMCYCWLHRRSSSYYYKIDLIFTYIIVVIGFCNAITTFVCNTYYSKYYYVKELETFFVTTTSLAISAIAQLHRKAKFFQISEKHNNHSKSFESFNRKIRNNKLLNDLTHNNNELNVENMKSLIDEYDTLANSSPYIPNKILKSFNKKYGKLHIWKPNALYGLDDLEKKNHIIKNCSIVKKSFYTWLISTKTDVSCNV